ncbi:TRAP-type C4-dicarboxylate transport system permease small subunit [Cytobacillus horneckiae]|uniref:TRAP transporter small permease n=1 Tax=Cytobacillus horneckiae TaxID=549687 RepID=UPI0019D05A22|nr:TRAP transporter small permease [Cytobacillus horneckiae]MBN6886789.1 TRAP transporter small permease [Cytobacillus horneckiae]MCM3177740.1 TRAP transporter small permease [Cytobacillus horneckiae]
MTRISDVITKVEEWLMIILIAALLIIITLSVAFRYFLNEPLSWAGEVSIFILVWITFLGGSWGLKHNSQASVSFLIDKFSGRMKKMLVIIQLLCMVTFLAFILFFSYKWIFLPSVLAQKSSSLLLPMWIPYSAVPIGLTFATIHLLVRISQFSVKKEEAR